MRRSQRLPLEQLTPYLWSPPDLLRQPAHQRLAAPDTLQWKAIFGNDRPVEIEVGFGKGAFLVAAAVAQPEISFFGIEVMRKYQLFTATRLAKRKLTNVRLARADARVLLRDRVVPSSVAAIHVYFPDPWWKKRHHKRRVFTPDFVAACARALSVCGRLFLATDVPDYFAIMTDLCNRRPELQLLPHIGSAHDLDYLTNFERKARERNLPIARAVYERVA